MKSYLKGITTGVVIGASTVAMLVPLTQRKRNGKTVATKAMKAFGTAIENIANDIFS